MSFQPIREELVTVMGGTGRTNAEPTNGNAPGNRLRWRAEPATPHPAVLPAPKR